MIGKPLLSVITKIQDEVIDEARAVLRALVRIQDGTYRIWHPRYGELPPATFQGLRPEYYTAPPAPRDKAAVQQWVADAPHRDPTQDWHRVQPGVPFEADDIAFVRRTLNGREHVVFYSLANLTVVDDEPPGDAAAAQPQGEDVATMAESATRRRKKIIAAIDALETKGNIYGTKATSRVEFCRLLRSSIGVAAEAYGYGDETIKKLVPESRNTRKSRG